MTEGVFLHASVHDPEHVVSKYDWRKFERRNRLNNLESRVKLRNRITARYLFDTLIINPVFNYMS
jgi:hypothetical protein